jgi:hypothetical protein
MRMHLKGSFVLVVVLLGCSGRRGLSPSSGGRLFPLNCDTETTRRRVTDSQPGRFQSHSETVETLWLSEVPGVVVDPRQAPRITIFTCDPERFSPEDWCPHGWTCRTTGGPPTPQCVRVDPIISAEGRVIVNCGYRATHSRSRPSDDVPGSGSATTDVGPTVTGTRYRRAYVRIE